MALIKLQGKTKIQGKTIFDAAPPTAESTAAAYIAAVESADGQSLESGVQTAYTDFIAGLWSDGLWNDLKSSCILAGARTLNGALVPLVGTAPTNNNFVSSDYSRSTGLVGDGSTKRLHTNRAQNDDPQDDMHIAAFIYTAGSFYHMGGSGNAPTQLIDYRTRNRSSSLFSTESSPYYINNKDNKLFAMARSSSSSYSVRQFNNDYSFNQTSGTPTSNPYYVFGNGSTAYSSSRISFYSIGESLDLTLLDNRVSTLMTDIAAAI